MLGDPVGGVLTSPLLSPGMGIHPLFGPRALAVAPPHEGYQRPGTQMTVADFLSGNGGGGGGGLQAGGLPGLSRAVGVCGEGGVVQRSLQREKASGDSGK